MRAALRPVLVLLALALLVLGGLPSAFAGPPASAATAGPRVEIETSKGVFVVELYPDKAPETVKNFLQYVESKHYDGLIFHRVIDGFMIQGGGFDESMNQRATKPPIKLEAQRGLSNERGTLAMARTNDPNSATSQFFVNVVDNARLDAHGGGYAVFGRVIDGMDVVDAIRRVPTRNFQQHQNVPAEPVKILKARLVTAVPTKAVPTKPVPTKPVPAKAVPAR